MFNCSIFIDAYPKELNLYPAFRTLVLALLVFQAVVALAQQKEVIYSEMVENPWKVRHVGGSITATNNGVSLLPTFILGKPALMFDFTAGNKKISFEPQLRFSMSGKPWSFIFWWRYKVFKNAKWTFNIGAHPAFIFREMPMQINGATKEVFTTQRNFATEVVPNYWITRNTSVGMYYLHANSIGPLGARSTHFVTLNANFNNILIGGKTYLKFNPQVYYLKMDKPDG